MSRFDRLMTDALPRFLNPRDKPQLKTAELIEVLLRADDDKETRVNELERAWAAYLGAARYRDVRQKFHVRKWTDPHKFAADVLGEAFLFDHAYRLVDKETGEVCYIHEPYQLDGQMIAQLGKLVAAGYKVYVTSRDALHFAGRTVVVDIRKPGGK